MTPRVDITSVPALSRGLRVKFDKVRQTTLLLMPECTVRLNRSAAEVILLVDGNRTVDEIINSLAHKYRCADMAGDVIEFIADANSKGWIEVRPLERS